MLAKSRRKLPVLQQLSPRLDKMIATYAMTASAVGVAMLAAASPAEGKIVYTKTRATITHIGNPYQLDLNNDGIVDFTIGFCSCQPYGTAVTIRSNNVGNMVIQQPGFSYSAAALISGAPIGPKQAFRSAYAAGGLQLEAAIATASLQRTTSIGPWAGGVTGRYLGLKFMINGQAHYGWARMTIGKQLSHVVLTGFAYETIANRPITAGQISGTAQHEPKSAQMPALPQDGPSLGMLARGSEAIDIWRRKEELAG